MQNEKQQFLLFSKKICLNPNVNRVSISICLVHTLGKSTFYTLFENFLLYLLYRIFVNFINYRKSNQSIVFFSYVHNLHKVIFCRYKVCPSIGQNKLDIVKIKHVAILYLYIKYLNILNIPELLITEINNNLCKIY